MHTFGGGREREGRGELTHPLSSYEDNSRKLNGKINTKLILIIIFSYGVIIIGHHEWHEKIPLQELTTFPPFLRFNYVKLWFDCGSHSEPVEKLREFIESHLLPLKLALKDSNMILSCGYKFHISFDYFYWNSASMITSLLQMVEFQDCSNVEIEMGVVFKRIDIGEMLLPVAAILKWLEKPADRTGNIAQVQKEKFLRIGLFSGIQNAQQMLGHLKTVYLILRYFHGKI